MRKPKDPAPLMAQLQKLIDGHSKGPRHTVKTLVKRYLESVEFNKLKARDSERRRLVLHILPHLGKDVAADLDLDRMAWYREARKKEKCLNRPDNKPPEPSTRNREVRQLSACLSWAVEHKHLTINPIRFAPMEDENNLRDTLPHAIDVDKLMTKCNRRLRAMIALTFGAGLRRGEVCSLPLSQVVWSTGQITLKGRDTKTGKSRQTVLPDRAARYVQLYLDSRNIHSEYVFATRSGRPISPRNFLREFQAACRRAGIAAAEGEKLVLHDLRAGFIGHQLEMGTPEKVIMEMTGHRTHAAFDRYVRVQPAWIAQAKIRSDAFDVQHLKAAGKRPAPASEPPIGDPKDDNDPERS